MNNGAHAADLRCLKEAGTQDRHRNAGQVEIEKNPRVHEESACKEVANVLPWNPPEHIRLSFFPATTLRFDFKSLSSCATPSTSRNAINSRPRATIPVPADNGLAQYYTEDAQRKEKQ